MQQKAEQPGISATPAAPGPAAAPGGGSGATPSPQPASLAARAPGQWRRIALMGIAALAAIYVVKLALGWALVGRFQIETDNAYVEADTSVIASEIAGTVAEVLVTDNQAVRSGDVLVRVADADYKARVAEAESTVATQKAALATVVARLKWQQSIIASAQANVATAQSDLERTSADFKRYSQLHSSQYASAQRYETAKSEADKAQSILARQRAALEAEREQLAMTEAQRIQIQAQVAQAEAQLEVARIALARTVIRSPIDGVAGNRGVQVGQYVRAGTQLLSIVPIPKVHVIANFKETQIEGLRRGQPAVIVADAFPNVPITGRVESFSPASGSRFSLLPPENATGNFTKIVQRVPVRIAVDLTGPLVGRLRPGLSVWVSIDRREPGAGEHADRLVEPPRAASNK